MTISHQILQYFLKEALPYLPAPPLKFCGGALWLGLFWILPSPLLSPSHTNIHQQGHLKAWEGYMKSVSVSPLMFLGVLTFLLQPLPWLLTLKTPSHLSCHWHSMCLEPLLHLGLMLNSCPSVMFSSPPLQFVFPSLVLQCPMFIIPLALVSPCLVSYL